jgi:3-isopropylmalate dehydrogenase
VHGSAPPLAGKNLANPMGAILSTALLLETLGCGELAAAVEGAVAATVRAGEGTPDIGGTLGTTAVGDAVVRRLGRPR